MPPKNKGENTKKAAGNAKKAASAAAKSAAANAAAEEAESAKWSQGSKSNKKADDAAAKKEEAARKKAEKDALMKEEEATLKGPKSASKGAQKKNAGPSKGTLDLSMLDGEPSKKGNAINASGIDDALDALSLANSSGNNAKIDMHPERRFKAAYTVFEERRLAEMADDKSLRRQQKIEQIRKEFEKSPDNPFNQELIGRYDMSREEKQALRDANTASKEARLGRS